MKSYILTEKELLEIANKIVETGEIPEEELKENLLITGWTAGEIIETYMKKTQNNKLKEYLPNNPSMVKTVLEDITKFKIPYQLKENISQFLNTELHKYSIENYGDAIKGFEDRLYYELEFIQEHSESSKKVFECKKILECLKNMSVENKTKYKELTLEEIYDYNYAYETLYIDFDSPTSIEALIYDTYYDKKRDEYYKRYEDEYRQFTAEYFTPQEVFDDIHKVNFYSSMFAWIENHGCDYEVLVEKLKDFSLRDLYEQYSTLEEVHVDTESDIMYFLDRIEVI